MDFHSGPASNHNQSQGCTGTSSINDRPKNLRSACDYCHQSKVKCSGGGIACARCTRETSNIPCHYSHPAKVGKPKGCKNKKTIEKLNALARLAGRDREAEIALAAGNTNEVVQHAGDLPENRTGSTELNLHSEDDEHNQQPSREPIKNLMECEPGSVIEAERYTGVSNFMDDGGLLSPRQSRDGSEGPITFSPLSTSEGFPSLPDFFFNDQIGTQEGNKLCGSHLFPAESADYLATPRSSTPLFGFRSGNSNISQCPIDWSLAASTNSQSARSSVLEIEDCDCFQKQASHLCELRRVERQHTRPQLDAVLRLSSTIFRSLDDSSNCQACADDLSISHLNVLVLRVLLRMIATLCREKGGTSVQFGSYSMDQEECAWLNMVIMSRLLTKCKTIIEVVGQRMLGSGRRAKSVDKEYFGHVFKALAASIDGYVQQMRKRSTNSEMDENRRRRHDSIMSHYV